VGRRNFGSPGSNGLPVNKLKPFDAEMLLSMWYLSWVTGSTASRSISYCPSHVTFGIVAQRRTYR
jgi:hypothetical protein